MDLFSHLGCLVCGILSFVFLICSNAFLIFWHSHKCTVSYLYFSQLECPSFRNDQFQFYQFCHSWQAVPSFVFASFMLFPFFENMLYENYLESNKTFSSFLSLIYEPIVQRPTSRCSVSQAKLQPTKDQNGNMSNNFSTCTEITGNHILCVSLFNVNIRKTSSSF